MLCRLEQRPHITGGLTGTVFTKTAEKLVDNPKYMKRIIYLARHRDMSIYKSIIDFLLCEVFPFRLKRKCFLYYEDKGPSFAEDPATSWTIDTINPYDIILSNFVLERCIESFGLSRRGNKKRGTWGQVLYDTQHFLEKFSDQFPTWSEGRSDQPK